MGLSISRGGDLTPEQPTIEENIKKANEILKKYGEELDQQYIKDNGYWEFLIWQYRKLCKPADMEEMLLDTAVNWGIKILFKGGDSMDLKEMGFDAIKFIQDETDLDDQLYKRLADNIKKEVPGHYMEPVAGKALEGIGKELQVPLETDE